MEKLDKIVKEYLEEDSDYALLITGGWGTGKTFYYENYLVPIIEQTALGTDANKKHIPITVSLFGVKSVEELQYQILLGTIPYWWESNWFKRKIKRIFRSRTGRLSASVAKILSKPLLKEYSLSYLSEVLSNSKEEASNNLTFKKLVLCLDDFERKSDDLKVKDLIGFINSIVDKETGKIIIIANEDKLEDDADFKSFKEKIIGHTIEFTPDINSVYDKIVDVKFSGDIQYKKFLSSKKEFILEIFSPNSNNLRTLTFILQKFHKINSFVELNLLEGHPLGKHKQFILEQLLRFCVAVGIEFKVGRLKYKDKENIDKPYLLSIDDLFKMSQSYNLQYSDNQNQITEIEGTAGDKFEHLINSYYLKIGHEYKFFDSIFSLVTGSDVVYEDRLIDEIIEKFEVELTKKDEPHRVVIQKLQSSVMDIEDNEFEDLIKELLNYVDEGLYELHEYINIFYFSFVLFNNPLKFEEGKLTKRLLKGIDKGLGRYKYNPHLHFGTNNPVYQNHKDAYDSILNKVEVINEELHLKEIKLEIDKVEELFYNDIKELVKQVQGLNSWSYKYPFLKHFEDKKVLEHLFSAPNRQRSWFIDFLKVRYMERSFLEDLVDEKEVLTFLSHEFEERVKDIDNVGPTNHLLNEINKVLKSAVELLNQVVKK